MSNEAPNLCDYLREAREAWAADMADHLDRCLNRGRPFPVGYRLLLAGDAAGSVRARRLVRMVDRRLEELRRPPAVRSGRAKR